MEANRSFPKNKNMVGIIISSWQWKRAISRSQCRYVCSVDEINPKIEHSHQTFYLNLSENSGMLFIPQIVQHST